MNRSFLTFLLSLFALTAVLYGGAFLVFHNLITSPVLPVEIMLGVLFAATALSHYIVMRAGKSTPQVFTRTYMGLTTGRLMLYSVFVLVYCFNHRNVAKQFVLTFFAFYIFYTIFEVRAVQSLMKKK